MFKVVKEILGHEVRVLQGDPIFTKLEISLETYPIELLNDISNLL